MGHWNYRLIRHDDSAWGPLYSLHEIHYDDEGQPESWTENALGPTGGSFPETHDEYLAMSKAFDHEAFEIVDGKLRLESYDTGLDHHLIDGNND